ncbi:hypothetical protein RFI_25929 [Reticulomyxa filosa]|uniref:Uncharacterized protein n=1 Tax=Reticulomyxa filosa TaxID=46433 RepID=X6MC71_RETFI|nr:hypothetical protein RFI_25929 [Reticulomyxa filosa]|eukprot:ETO11449.1 hypothetical protein RFI_25929 [Reticulomyxa filosa]
MFHELKFYKIVQYLRVKLTYAQNIIKIKNDVKICVLFFQTGTCSKKNCKILGFSCSFFFFFQNGHNIDEIAYIISSIKLHYSVFVSETETCIFFFLHNLQIETKNYVYTYFVFCFAVLIKLSACEAVNKNAGIIYLKQKHFDTGTVRITKSGKYQLCEDISFNPLRNVDHPNEEGAYYPLESEADLYPGVQKKKKESI